MPRRKLTVERERERERKGERKRGFGGERGIFRERKEGEEMGERGRKGEERKMNNKVYMVVYYLSSSKPTQSSRVSQWISLSLRAHSANGHTSATHSASPPPQINKHASQHKNRPISMHGFLALA